MDVRSEILNEDCLRWLENQRGVELSLTFVDPPFRQGKNYRYFDDSQPEETYWDWLKEIVAKIYRGTAPGGAIYFMHREKNTEHVLNVLRETGWVYQNLIVWKKKTSAIPAPWRYSKQFQIIAFATKHKKPAVFHRLRIDLPVPREYNHQRANGVYVSDVWDDIRELTSGYFAGEEAIRASNGERLHTQQSPIALLLRIILTSTRPGDLVLDPFAGTGTTLVVARQLKRHSIGIEIDPEFVKVIERRVTHPRPADSVIRYYQYYRFTRNLNKIWALEKVPVLAEQETFV
jgi:site-specific DNA-methyltransferase (adenine-specific)